MRLLLGTLAGALAWMVIVTALGFLLGQLWPELSVASRNPVTLTVPMLIARLGVSFLASILSGAIAARIGTATAALAAGVLLLLGWGTYHVTVIWHLFPLWYHLTFFVSLPLLSWFGSRFAQSPASRP